MQGRPHASRALSVVERMSFRVEVLRVVRMALTRLARDQTTQNGGSVTGAVCKSQSSPNSRERG